MFWKDTLSGGSWALVRHAPAGGVWHTATFDDFINIVSQSFIVLPLLFSDDLAGTAVYGTYESNQTSPLFFSVPFNVSSSTQVLFMSGDGSRYLVANLAAVTFRTVAIGMNASFSSSSTSPAGGLYQ